MFYPIKEAPNIIMLIKLLKNTVREPKSKAALTNGVFYCAMIIEVHVIHVLKTKQTFTFVSLFNVTIFLVFPLDQPTIAVPRLDYSSSIIVYLYVFKIIISKGKKCAKRSILTFIPKTTA